MKYEIWKKVKVPNEKTTKPSEKSIEMRMGLVVEEQTKEDFLESFISQIKEFREHVLRISTQYKQLRFLKDSLSDDQLIVQMDFAENYSCQSLDEIQSTYWKQTSVTLHPTVIYYKHGQELLHKSVIFVSDEERHNAVLVYTFIKELISHI